MFLTELHLLTILNIDSNSLQFVGLSSKDCYFMCRNKNGIINANLYQHVFLLLSLIIDVAVAIDAGCCHLCRLLQLMPAVVIDASCCH